MNLEAQALELFSLEGRVAIVTGATRGIGASIVRHFIAAGAKVAITHRGTERNLRLSAELIDEFGSARMMAVTADAASGPEMESATDQVTAAFGTVDLLVLNAAHVGKRPWDQITVQDWDRMMEVNLRGAFVASLAAVEGMRKNGYGKIITIGSVMATFGDPRALDYVTTKGGLIAFTRSLSRCEGENGIRVNCVIPGAIQVEREDEEGVNPEATLVHMKQVQALKYRGQPPDIAAAAQFLASPASDFITGQVLTVDGGWTNF
jgi:3-oxoacyl-[acyl-carrier protein] reductase